MSGRRRLVCDTPGCGAERRRWHRLCERCFASLPGDIRNGITSAHKEHRMADWREWKRRAGQSLADRLATRRPPVDPATVYERTARLLGER